MRYDSSYKSHVDICICVQTPRPHGDDTTTLRRINSHRYAGIRPLTIKLMMNHSGWADPAHGGCRSTLYLQPSYGGPDAVG